MSGVTGSLDFWGSLSPLFSSGGSSAPGSAPLNSSSGASTGSIVGTIIQGTAGNADTSGSSGGGIGGVASAAGSSFLGGVGGTIADWAKTIIAGLFRGPTKHMSWTQADTAGAQLAQKLTDALRSAYSSAQFDAIGTKYAAYMIAYMKTVARWNGNAVLPKETVIQDMLAFQAKGDNIHGITHIWALWNLSNTDEESTTEFPGYVYTDMHATLDRAIQEVTGQANVGTSVLVSNNPGAAMKASQAGFFSGTVGIVIAVAVAVVLLVSLGRK